MGGVWSRVSGQDARDQSIFYRACHMNDKMMQQLRTMGIDKKKLRALYEIFSIMDRDSSGEINLSEFFTYIDVKRTRFSEKAFAVMDRDGSGEVDFVEFVLAVWNYCSFSKASLVRYAFDLYDLDGSGEIELSEASRCIREVWGSEWEQNANAQKVMMKLEAIMRGNPDGRLTITMFQEFAQRHPVLLFPAFQLQTEIQQRVLGERFWRKAARMRGSVNPADLNWKNVEKIAVLSRQASNNFHKAMEEAMDEDTSERAEEMKKGRLNLSFRKATRGKPRVFMDDPDDRRRVGGVGAISTPVVSIDSKDPSPFSKRKKASIAESLSTNEIGVKNKSPTAAQMKRASKQNPTQNKSLRVEDL
ncbi:hypothetical protein Poli38472_010218 [Pythium oligandrum]|uniref:EF-hand domain-containing protein n=1 Tax=Pythium oligandrum TaxID=41045 RepID=A0A8K1C8J3_PYTOL|nr:hypothetical protein Poli38472_010218 [Pythium oligandrum]|eukprot:TMW58659.1 hypothetical protein Poli38472_010218 [Pythium oligandrum]